MARDDIETGSRIAADRETIREWAEEHDAVPVRYAGAEGEAGRPRLVPADRVGRGHEEVSWEAFFDELEQNDRVVVYHGAGRDEAFEVVARDEATTRAAVESEAVEEALLEGETVTTEVTETVVVERTIVEEATIESEVVGREVVDEELVDAELLAREVADCEVTEVRGEEAEATDAGHLEMDRFQVGYRSPGRLDVEVTVDEGWSLTREVLERVTVESRVVATDATETDTLETDTLEGTVDVAGVQETILESDLLGPGTVSERVVESGAIESEFREGGVVESRLMERRTVEEEVSLRKRYAGEIADGETVAAETVHSEVVGSEIVEDERLRVAGATESAGEMGEVAGTGETGEVAETGRVVPTADDEGKTVVDATGDELGIVAEVEGGTLYVDPHPSITDRIKAALDWGDVDEDDAYPIPADHVVRITGNRVELAVDEGAAE